MKKSNSVWLTGVLLIGFLCFSFSPKNEKLVNHRFNEDYSGKNLDRVAFPVGGIGAGMFCLEGTGAISHLSINNRPEIYNEPFAFAAISVKGARNGANVLETQLPTWKLWMASEMGRLVLNI